MESENKSMENSDSKDENKSTSTNDMAINSQDKALESEKEGTPNIINEWNTSEAKTIPFDTSKSDDSSIIE